MCVENGVLGCKVEESHVCKECYSPFKLNPQGICEIDSCKKYNEYGCTACNCGFFLTQEGVCKPMETGCIRYQRGSCSDCMPNFRLQGLTCEIEGCQERSGITCKSCSTGYTETEKGGCQLSNCSDWNNGLCKNCEDGFNLVSGKCKKNSLTVNVAAN